jgi:hypothetical protein
MYARNIDYIVIALIANSIVSPLLIRAQEMLAENIGVEVARTTHSNYHYVQRSLLVTSRLLSPNYLIQAALAPSGFGVKSVIGAPLSTVLFSKS